MLQGRGRVYWPYGYGLTSTGGFGSEIRTRQMRAAAPLMIDVGMGGRLVTIPISRSEMCSSISDKLDLEVNQCYLMLEGKPLQWGRLLGDYDVTDRCTIQVLRILPGGGTFFSFIAPCWCTNLSYWFLYVSLSLFYSNPIVLPRSTVF